MDITFRCKDIEAVGYYFHQNLTCTYCSKVLSVGPIYQGATTGSICGRCVGEVSILISQKVLQRATSYELIAQFLEFPCHNSPACKAMLHWGQVSKHEAKCDGMITCPIYNCHLQCGINMMRKHICYNHEPTQILHFINMPNTKQVRSTIKMGQVFVVSMVFDYKIHSSVETDAFDFKRYRYNASVKCNRCTFQAVHKGIKVQRFSNDSHKCVPQQHPTLFCDCEHEHYEAWIMIYDESTTNSTEVLNRQAVFKLLNEYRTCKVEQDLLTTKPLAMESSNNLKQISVKLLEELLCVCGNYMHIPVYICVNGHSLCDNCTTDHCPICKCVIIGRNFPLERLSELVEYPCQFQQFGCPLKLENGEWKTHLSNCRYRTVDCPIVICDHVMSLINVENHFQEKHSHFLFNQKSVLSKPIDHYNMSCEYTVFGGELFVLKFQCEGESLPVTFDCIRVYPDENNLHDSYKFHFKFVGNDRGLEFGLDELCKNGIEELGSDSLVINDVLLKRFTSKTPNACLKFKCLISKIE